MSWRARMTRAVAVLTRGTNALDEVRMCCPECGSALVNAEGASSIGHRYRAA